MKNKKPNYIGENIAILACSNWQLYEKGIPGNFKLWTINGLCQVDKLKGRIDLLFDMHPWSETSDDYPIPEYYYLLKEQEYDYHIVKPSYGDGDSLQNIIIYPLDEIIKEYGRNLKNSLPEMILYAWWIGGIKNIYLYGISNTEFTKYPEMGASLFQAIGFARGKGINIYFVTDCDYDRDDDIYGYYKLTKDRIKE